MLQIGYLLEVEQLIVLIVSDGVVLLVVESHAGGVFGSSVVAHGLDEDGALVDDHVIDLGWVVFILEGVFVGGEGLDGQVGGQDGSVFSHDVRCLGYSSSCQVLKVGFVSLCHGYDIYIIQQFSNLKFRPISPTLCPLVFHPPFLQKNEVFYFPLFLCSGGEMDILYN